MDRPVARGGWTCNIPIMIYSGVMSVLCREVGVQERGKCERNGDFVL